MPLHPHRPVRTTIGIAAALMWLAAAAMALELVAWDVATPRVVLVVALAATSTVAWLVLYAVAAIAAPLRALTDASGNRSTYVAFAEGWDLAMSRRNDADDIDQLTPIPIQRGGSQPRRTH